MVGHRNPEISIQKENIKKVIRKEEDVLMQDWEIDSFITSFNFIAIENANLFKEKDITPDSFYPLVSWVIYSKELIEILLTSCKIIFPDEQKFKFIKQFIEKHNEIEDVLAVRMKKTFWLKNNS